MQQFVDIRSGQVVSAEKCISTIQPDGRAYRITYPGPQRGKAIIGAAIFQEYYQPLYKEPQGAA